MHQLPLSEFYQRLRADPACGLSEDEAAQRLTRDGPNALVPRRRTPEILRFLQHLTKLFALLLWAGAALSFVAEWLMPGQGNLYIGIALAAVVVLNAAFSY